MAVGRSSLLVLSLALAVAIAPGRAETPLPAPTAPSDNRAAAQAEFDRIQADIRLGDERMAALKAEVDQLERDRVRIAAELLAAGDRSRKLEASLADAEARMTSLEA
ncbi:hypothetical protein J8J27_24060, partial [Mycobacterium tuberculosis]|nr:hypothetical protein [Mycobacterium tuberculosis]